MVIVILRSHNDFKRQILGMIKMLMKIKRILINKILQKRQKIKNLLIKILIFLTEQKDKLSFVIIGELLKMMKVLKL